jgi:DNA-binding transcriptional ArsR family regulator
VSGDAADLWQQIRAGVTPPPCTLDDVVATFQKRLYLPDPTMLLATLGTVAANRLPGPAVWLLNVAPPSHAKTEMILTLYPLADVHPTGPLTEAALLSGTPRRDQADGARGGLLHQIGAFGILAVKDFGSILSMRAEQRGQLLGALREIYDGAWTRPVGSDGGRVLHWSGKLGLIGGCTPVIDQHHAVTANLGERFIFVRAAEVDANEQADAALDAGDDDATRAELATAVAGLLGNLEPGERPPLGEDDRASIRALTTLVVRARSAVERDRYSREIELVPGAEGPARLVKTLVQLRAGLLALGAEPEKAWQVVRRCGLDSLPQTRRRVLELLAHGTGQRSTTDVAEVLDYPTSTTRRALEDLTAYGLVRRIRGGAGKPDRWVATEFTSKRWQTVYPQNHTPSL